MKMVFLTGFDGDVLPINSDVIGHIDKAAKGIIGESLLYTKNGLSVRLKGTPKQIGIEINRQLSDFVQMAADDLQQMRLKGF